MGGRCKFVARPPVSIAGCEENMPHTPAMEARPSIEHLL